ncbi:GH25 family lysozyme [Phaeobacter sp. PT47_59]|uniref:glycoside hydrolase family 25 protein n=1 Tax=Phaeobacter sp. PT47_59 TaxID=3029979 RepID=UPI00238013EB|nr:GH25 family lysozyme [Phaeobacter sp. PT47_59]MDE4174451.1 GH25 family lysozyme [Phaeobacter sp. PT47_59]
MLRFWLALVLVLGVSGCGQPPEPEQSAPTQRPDAEQLSELVTFPRFGDSDPHSWEGRTPYSYAIHGIDVSRWQGEIDWAKAKRAGVSFAYLKATEGGDLVDPMFRENWRAAGRAGLPRGAYHYFYFCRPAEQQARWFIRNVPKDARALPHVLDMEWNPHSKTCRLRPDGARVRTEARKFLNILEAHYGRRPVIYTTVDFFAETGIGRLKGGEFWLRSVAGHPRKTYPGAYWRFWQYSGTGRVSGIEGDVDLNVFHDSPETWLRWSGQLKP